MSFILDALRKSDARRQQAGAPGLNSPEPPRRPRRRRMWPVFATVLVVFVVAAAAVYVVRPDWVPGSMAGGSRTQADDGESASTPADTVAAGAQAPERSTPEVASDQLVQQGSGEEARRGVPPAPLAGGDSDENLESDESQQPEPIDRRAPIPASSDRTVVRREPAERESRPIPAEEATKELERRMAEEAASRRERPQRPAETPDDAARPDRASGDSLPGREPAGEAGPLSEGVAGHLRAWELPLSVRRNLPELDLSIHVFSPVESERFVLINGERYGPGDSIGEVEIVDISRDGAIVDFRSHRFLLEPR